MKKFLFYLAFICCIFSSCNKENLIEPQLTNIYFSYSINEGNMLTRSSNIFNDIFYDKILSGELVPDTFNIKLIEQTTGETYEFQGKWKEKDMLTIKTGTYKIIGTSTAKGNYIQNKCSLKFNTEIKINNSDTEIILPAQYNCFLLIFDSENIKEVYNCFNEYYELHDYYSSECPKLFMINNIIYAFSYKLFNESYNRSNPVIKIILNDNSIIKIFTKTTNFEFGKYYIYNTINNNFSIPEMEQGNI